MNHQEYINSEEYLIEQIRTLICYLDIKDVILLMENEGFTKDKIYLCYQSALILNKYEFEGKKEKDV